jgi:hypothetical protein
VPRRAEGAGADAALVGVRLVALAYLVLSHQERITGGFNGDVFRYIEMARAHGVAYRDFQVEYPPVTYALIKVLTGTDAARGMVTVAVSQVACDLGTAAALGWRWGRPAMRWYLVLGLPFLVYPFPYLRIDLLSVLLAVGAVALVTLPPGPSGSGRARPAAAEWAGGALLAAAVLAKVWPLALVPLVVIGRRWRALAAFAAVGAVLGGAWLAVAGPGGVQQVVSFREATGWQVESLAGSLWHLHDPSRLKVESGAFRTGVMPWFARPLLGALSAAFVAGAWGLAARRPGHGRGAGDRVLVAEAPLAAVLALLLFAPILSPQYVVWMLPFAALAAAAGDRTVGHLALAVTALTTASFVFVGAAASGWVAAIALVVARNLVLVALLVVTFQTLSGVRDGAAHSQLRRLKYRYRPTVQTTMSPRAEG